MKTFAYTVRPKIPEKLKALEELANNLWLSWNFDAVNLFMRLDDEAWNRSRQNPARALGQVPQAKLEEIANDESFLAALGLVHEKLPELMRHLARRAA